MQPPPPITNSFRIEKNNYVGALIDIGQAGTLQLAVDVIYDDGETDRLISPDTLFSTGANQILVTDHPAKKYGWITGGQIITLSGGPFPRGSIWAQIYVLRTNAFSNGKDVQSIIGSGNAYNRHAIAIGVYDIDQYATWAFQGTVASDATVGTHVCTLTVTPLAGNEMEFLYGRMILSGAAALAANASILDDSGNILVGINLEAAAGTFSFPQAPGSAAGGDSTAAGTKFFISGAMQLVLTLTTSTVSQTQTFSCVCRIRGSVRPSAVLADSVGTPVTTTNTNKLF